MNGYQVHQEWMKHNAGAEARSAERMRAAGEWVRSQLPDLDDGSDGPDPFALLVTLELQSRLGRGKVRASTVRRKLAAYHRERRRRGYITADELADELERVQVAA